MKITGVKKTIRLTKKGTKKTRKKVVKKDFQLLSLVSLVHRNRQ